MRQLTLLLLLSIYNQGFLKAHDKIDSTEFLIKKLVNEINQLPRTNESGQGDFKYQSQYSIDWDKKSRTLTLIDKRYRPNSEEKLSNEHIAEFDIRTLHNKGVYVKSIRQDNNISLQIFTANNNKKIKSLTYDNGEYRFGMYQDRLTIGSWDSSLINKQLNTTKELLIQIIQLNTNWGNKANPDIGKTLMSEIIKEQGFNYSSITFEQNDDSPLFLNSTVEEPALFLGSKSDKENRELINNYIIEQIDKKGIKMKGNLSGTIIISKSGDVEDFKSFKMNETKVEKEVKTIVLSMPNWKAGKQKGNYVRTSYTILIKK
ncbi:MAG: hypothetical protein RJQ00_03245 [Vicingaceae bacterium]